MNIMRTLLALVFAAGGLYGLYLMFTSEINTGQNFHNYFPWALGAGIVFLAVGAALTAFDGEEDLITDYTDAEK
jgi:hypothetical protein